MKKKGLMWTLLAVVLVSSLGINRADAEQLHTWSKYTTAQVQSGYKSTEYVRTDNPVSADAITKVYVGSYMGFTPATGEFDLISVYGDSTRNYGQDFTENLVQLAGGREFKFNNWDMTTAYRYDGQYQSEDLMYNGQPCGAYRCVIYSTRVNTPKYVDGQGSYVQKIRSDNASSFPTSGKAPDGYWYVYEGTNQIPDVTVSNNSTVVRQGNTVFLSGTVHDLENDNVKVSATINGITREVTMSNTSQSPTWQLSWSSNLLPEGTYTNIAVNATDAIQ